VKVHWTDTALGHLRAIHTYIARHSPDYAQRTVDRLTRRSQQISAFPLAGRVVPELDVEQVREVFEGPYRLVYHIGPDQIDVIAVIHGAERPWIG
jgi:toxin ParE1/3/4